MRSMLNKVKEVKMIAGSSGCFIPYTMKARTLAKMGSEMATATIAARRMTMVRIYLEKS